jgi:two-component system phosphate regulon sensor histidine kinase PhoR
LGGFVETLQTLQLSDVERARYLDLMAVQADRMQSLVSDLLMLSRLEGSPPPGATQWVPLPNLMLQLEQDAHALSAVLNPLSLRGHTCVFRTALAMEIAGSPSELHSALSNLVGNAIRYTPPSGRIEVQLMSLPDGRVACSVADTGPGIAPEHIPRLTERFYRVDRSRSRDTGGTGLGLAIVKHVAQRHGAELKIESLLGKGSTFTITFPASRVRPLTS